METIKLPVLTCFNRSYGVIERLSITPDRQRIFTVDITDVTNIAIEWDGPEKLITIKIPETFYDGSKEFEAIPVELTNGEWHECKVQAISLQIIVIGREDK